MRILITILLLTCVIFAQAQIQDTLQDEYYREIDWKFYPDSMIVLSDSTYEFKAEPYDYNDPGAIARTVGNYVVDFIGHRYKIIDSTLTTLTVWDEYRTGQAPQTYQIARCYLSVGNGDARYLGSVDYSTLDKSARWKINGADNELIWQQMLRNPVDSITFKQDITIPSTEYTLYADTTDRTLSVDLGNGVVLQVGQESQIKVYNNTADTIKNGRICGGIGVYDTRISIELASKKNRYSALLCATEDIPPYSFGLCVETAGKVRGLSTTGLAVAPMFVDTLGLLTNVQPQHPYYSYQVGAVTKIDETEGEIQFRSDGVNFYNSVRSIMDGSIRETFDFRTYSDGTNVYGVLSNPTGADNLTLVYSDGWYDFPVPDTIQLIEGTATNPQIQYVYIDDATRTLSVSTGGYPSLEHSKVSTSVVSDAVTAQSVGVLRNQNINDHFKSDNDNGHVLHMAERIRVMNSEWESGAAGTLTGTPSNVYIDVTGGMIWQMHLQTFPAQTMSTGDDIHVVNDPTTPYRATTNLNDITVYSDGSNWNNSWSNIVVWGVCNKTGEISHIMVNLPSDGYQSEDLAIEDRSNYSNYTIPRIFRGVGFLIGRYSIRKSGGNFTYNSGYLDLRGYIPNNTAGGGTGSSGITDYTQLDDTPSSLIALALQRVSADGTALENVLAENILLTEFDSTGFTVDTSQVNGLNVFREDINSNTNNLSNHGLSATTAIDPTTTDAIEVGGLTSSSYTQQQSGNGTNFKISAGGIFGTYAVDVFSSTTGALMRFYGISGGVPTQSIGLDGRTGKVTHAQGSGLDLESVVYKDLTGGTTNIDGLTLSYNGDDILDIISDSVAGGAGVSFGLDNQIPYMNFDEDDYDYSASLTFDGTELKTTDIEATDDLVVGDDISSGGTISIIGSATTLKVWNATVDFPLYYNSSSSTSGYGKIWGRATGSLPMWTTTGGTFSFDLTAASDFWKKENFKLIDSPLDKILSLQSYHFDWKKDYPTKAPKDSINIEVIENDGNYESTGFIAQEAVKIIPEIVSEVDENGYLQVDYDGLIPYLVEAIKEQQKQIDELRKQIEELK